MKVRKPRDPAGLDRHPFAVRAGQHERRRRAGRAAPSRRRPAPLRRASRRARRRAQRRQARHDARCGRARPSMTVARPGRPGRPGRRSRAPRPSPAGCRPCRRSGSASAGAHPVAEQVVEYRGEAAGRRPSGCRAARCARRAPRPSSSSSAPRSELVPQSTSDEAVHGRCMLQARCVSGCPAARRRRACRPGSRGRRLRRPAARGRRRASSSRESSGASGAFQVGEPAREFLVADVQVQPPRGHVELDHVAVLHHAPAARRPRLRARCAAPRCRRRCRSCARR